MKAQIRPYRQIVTLLWILLGLAVNARANGDPVVKMNLLIGSANQINVDSTVTVVDSNLIGGTYTSLNKISLMIDESSQGTITGSFTVSVKFHIKATQSNGSITEFDTTLSIGYEGAGVYPQEHALYFSNAYRVEARVISRTTNVGWNVWQLLTVTNEITSAPFYAFSCSLGQIDTLSSENLSANTINDQLFVSWPYRAMADEYDLEWTFIDSSAIASGNYGSTGSYDINQIFENNATRVTIKSTTYKIPLIYDGKGILFFRARSVQYSGNNGGRLESNWSTAQSSIGIFNFNGHERKLNWQATTTFAEDGKRKTVVQYMDGTLKPRQVVTKDNTTDSTIVAETFYDQQGRPTIEVLPSPSLSNIIKYNQNFNIASNGGEYTSDQFDEITSGNFCTGKADSMSVSSGASQYYSPNNPNANSGIHRFIPDAKNYPFAQTEYTPDNTDRISRKGGVGPTFQFGGGHETQYFYGSPSQEELDALFGTEVGDHSHYFKNMVRDANGQYSVSYLDMHGRTIATGLSGKPTSAMDTLSSYVEQSITETLADSNSAVIQDLSMQTSKGILVPKAGTYTFNYHLDPNTLSLASCTSTLCYDCLYDLHISMSGGCNNTAFGGQPFDTLFANFSIGNIDGACNGSGFNISFSKYLTEGSYNITKDLSVSQYGLEYYRDSIFAANNLCRSMETFVEEQRSARQVNNSCTPDCSTCIANVGSWDDFRNNYLANGGIETDTASYTGQAWNAYNDALANCQTLCDSLANDADDIRSIMLEDVSPPSGQYTKRNVSTRSIFATDFLTFTFNSPFRLVTYYDEEGKLDSVYDEASQSLVPPNKLTIDAFTEKFKRSWAESLLPLHPEYCRLQKYLDLKASFSWDRRFEATDTYAEALAKGYLNPINSNYSSRFTRYGYFPGNTHPDQDPLSQYAGHDYLTDLRNQMNAYGDNTNNPNHLNLWNYATVITVCDSTNTSCYSTYSQDANAFNSTLTCDGDLDMEWRNFRAMYLQIKKKLIAAQLASCSSAPSTATLLGEGYVPRFGGAEEILAANDIPIPTSPSGAASMQSSYSDSVGIQYDSTCYAYSSQWLDALKNCNYDSAAKATIIGELVQVCKGGSDESHPYGSSTVAPSSSYQFKSFEEVITNYNSIHGIATSPACTADNIIAPKPYNRQTIYTTKPIWSKPDSCECTNLTNIHQQYALDSTGYTGFSDYLQKKYQTSITDSTLTTLLNMCSSSSATCANLQTPIALPAVFQCNAGNTCADCNTIDTLYKAFVAKYPTIVPTKQRTDSASQADNLLFEKYMNTRLGFDKTTADYLDFLQNCKFTIATTYSCDTLKKWFSDYHHYFGGSPHLDATGSDTTHWRPNYGGNDYNIAAPLSDLFRHGYAQLPDSLHNPDSLYGGHIDWDYYDTICVDTSGFSFEFRIKVPDSTVGGAQIPVRCVVGTDNDAGPGSVSAFFRNVTTLDGAMCTHSFDGYNEQCTVFPGLQAHFNDFRTVRMQFRNKNCKVFLDDVLVSEITLEAPLTKITYLTVVTYSTKSIIDYYRLTDAAGNYMYNEEFNLASDLAVPTKKCSVDCDRGFASYFNRVTGGQYTSQQVSDLYFSSCGLFFNPSCPSDTLLYLQNEFKNLYYNHGKKFDQDGNDSTTIKFDVGRLFNSTGFTNKQIIKNGVYQFPDTLGTPPFENNADIDKLFLDSACINGNMSMEYRIKFPRDSSEVRHRMAFLMYSNIDEQYYVNWYSYHDEKYYVDWDLNNPTNSLVNYSFPSIPGGDTVVTNVSQLPQDFSNWRIVKFLMKDSLFSIYVDGALIRSFIFPIAPSRHKFVGYSLSSTADHNLGLAIDWIKAYDESGKLFYDEEFNDPGKMSTFSDSMQCAKPSYPEAFANYYNGYRHTNFTAAQIDSIYHSANLSSNGADSIVPLLCGSAVAVVPPVDLTVFNVTNCTDSSFFIYSNATEIYHAYRDSTLGSFENGYRAKCLQAYKMESFTVTHTESEFQYTLYYYDQAGNLVKTVAPKGVHEDRNPIWLDQIKSERANRRTLLPSHTEPSQYRYNTLNQVVAQQTPDAGQSEFWYDRIGRLALSQNARQRAVSAVFTDQLFSYSQYDDIGRLTQVGQIRNHAGESVDDNLTRDPEALHEWFYQNGAYIGQITATVYDHEYTMFSNVDDRLIVKQRNLRNRISYSLFSDTSGTSAFNHGTFYSYDILGNIDTVLQDYGVKDVFPNVMNANGNRFKKISYNYDLVSGKVNKVAYQAGWADQLFHRYSYDAENRLVLAETSLDDRHWDKDGRYEYYRHGPLARMVLGDQQVQGLDYAYTLQGWIAGVNSTILDSTRDMGGDGLAGGENQYTARDAFGFNLNYFTADYTPISSQVMPFPAAMGYLSSSEYRPLYNGNISSIAVNNRVLNKAGNTGGPLMFYNYRYDQLNRIVGMDAYNKSNLSANDWQGLTTMNFFRERVGYDPSGNILKYLRNGNKASYQMDSLTYSYLPSSNKLDFVRDQVSAGAYGTVAGDIPDIDNQASNNYGYDEIGNLVRDNAEGITDIKWNVYGKILEITKTPTANQPITKIAFTYDPQGNRVSKLVQKNNGINTYTWYARDAQGNVMAVYSSSGSASDLSALPLTVSERDIYGSSRLGLYSGTLNVDNGPHDYKDSNSVKYYRGLRQYELTNHLGNVLATISDKKKPVYVSGALSYYDADVTTAQDYYPFGMQMPGRIGYQTQGGWVSEPGTGTDNSLPADIAIDTRNNNLPPEYNATSSIELNPGFESGASDAFYAYISPDAGGGSGSGGDGSSSLNGAYRYGFNGKENDNEVKGSGNQQDYGMRIYDPRLGRFLSVDPVTKKFPELTPYQYASNTPVAATDLDGLEGLGGPPPSAAYASNKELFDDLVAKRNTPRVQSAARAGAAVSLVGALAMDAFVTKGWATRMLLASQVFGAMEHNRASTPEGRIAQDKRSKDALADAFITASTGILVGRIGQTTKYFTNVPQSIYKGFTNAESDVINEAQGIMDSKGLDLLKEAAKQGKQASVSINGKIITFEPDIPSGIGFRGMTNSDAKGFHLGIDAFKDPEELTKTVLHELHRLRFSEVVKTGEIYPEAASATTKEADAFANSAQGLIKKN